MNILISAYAISPNHGSEPGMGWNWVVHIAKYCNVFVITESEFKSAIEKALEKLSYKENLRFYFNDIGEEARKMCWNQGDYRFYYYYRRWQKRTLQIAKDIIKDNHIDVIHQLNMIGYREPGYLWKLNDSHFVWGPVGGFNFVSFSYFPALGFKKALFYFFKNTLNYIQAHLNLRVRYAVNKAEIIFAASGNTKLALKRFFKKDSVLLNETGCSLNIYKYRIPQSNKDFNILWVGRFIPTKLLGLALQTIYKVKHLPNLKFHIVGDGTSKDSWKEYSKKLAIENFCVWHGKIRHDEVQDLMRSSDLLFFSSIVEGTSHVILEAISNSLPVLCFDTCGHGEIVNEDIGRKVKMSNPKKSIDGFAKEIECLYNNRDKLTKMSLNCQAKVVELSWEEKAKKMVSYYNSIFEK